MTPEEYADFVRCAPKWRHGPDGKPLFDDKGSAILDLLRTWRGFVYFCMTYLKIEDKDKGVDAPFVLWKCQKKLSAKLLAGRWILVLKARQLGITWVVAAFVLWKMIYFRSYHSVVLTQGLDYAIEFCDDKIRYMYDRLPGYYKFPLDKDTKKVISFGGGHRSRIDALASSKKAGRSKTANMLVWDEAAFQQFFTDSHNAAEPTLKNANGQAVVISTSDGAKGGFYKKCRAAMDGKGNYEFVFFPWWANPNRDEAWYEKEKEDHAGDPTYMSREFPSTASEAFEAAGGRVYPYFSRKIAPYGSILKVPLASIPFEAKRYRFVDPGEKHSPFVCLWAVVFEGKQPRLTVDPSCEYFIEDMIGWAFKPDSDDYADSHKDGPDALRYGVVTFDIHSHLHIYRELYIHDAAGKGHSPESMVAEVKKLRGWDLMDEGRNLWKARENVESFELTVYDPRKPLYGNTFCDLDMGAIPSEIPDGAKGRHPELNAGVGMVNRLVLGGLRRGVKIVQSEEDHLREISQGGNPLSKMGIRTGRPVQDRLRAIVKKKQKLSRSRFRTIRSYR